MLEEENPLIQPENYFKGYDNQIEDLKHKPELIAFDKLCFDVFEHSECGRAFIELVKERYLIPSLVSKGNATYQLDVLWQEGFKDFVRMILSCITSHKQRIKAGS